MTSPECLEKLGVCIRWDVDTEVKGIYRADEEGGRKEERQEER